MEASEDTLSKVASYRSVRIMRGKKEVMTLTEFMQRATPRDAIGLREAIGMHLARIFKTAAFNFEVFEDVCTSPINLAVSFWINTGTETHVSMLHTIEYGLSLMQELPETNRAIEGLIPQSVTTFWKKRGRRVPRGCRVFKAHEAEAVLSKFEKRLEPEEIIVLYDEIERMSGWMRIAI